VETRKQATPVFTTLCVLIGVLVTIQLWLLSAALESVLAGKCDAAWPAACASAALFVVCAGLLAYGLALDARLQRRVGGDVP
jgi:hypothetical protein